MLELGEVLLAAAARSGEEAGASTRARFAGGSTGPKGPDGCATAADTQEAQRAHGGSVGVRRRGWPEPPPPGRPRANKASGAEPDATRAGAVRRDIAFDLGVWRQLMQASLISLVSPQGNCRGEGLRLDGYGPLTEGAPGEVGCFRGRFVSGLWDAEAHLKAGAPRARSLVELLRARDLRPLVVRPHSVSRRVPLWASAGAAGAAQQPWRRRNLSYIPSHPEVPTWFVAAERHHAANGGADTRPRGVFSSIQALLQADR